MIHGLASFETSSGASRDGRDTSEPCLIRVELVAANLRIGYVSDLEQGLRSLRVSRNIRSAHRSIAVMVSRHPDICPVRRCSTIGDQAGQCV